jgi:hypothetical protein
LPLPLNAPGRLDVAAARQISQVDHAGRRRARHHREKEAIEVSAFNLIEAFANPTPCSPRAQTQSFLAKVAVACNHLLNF